VATFVFVGIAWIPFYLPAGVPVDSWIAIIARLFGLAWASAWQAYGLSVMVARRAAPGSVLV